MPKDKHKKKKRPHVTGSLKRGLIYQHAVAQVAKSIDPSAQIEVGAWANGPDGRRDLDVLIRPREGSSAPSVVIECKDWNRPIGIGFIDALDSKRKDISAAIAMICSNSGFTEEALHKAARVGIPALAALIEGDSRIRVIVREQIYTRIVEFQRHGPQFHHQPLTLEDQGKISGAYTKEWLYEGKSMEAWVTAKLMRIASLATQSKSFIDRFTFRTTVPVVARGVKLSLSGIDIRGAFTVQWMTQIGEIGASQGMYDYLHKRVILGPGPYQVQLKNINSATWGAPVDRENVPPRLLVPLDKREKPEIPYHEWIFAMLKNMPQSDPKDAPDLDSFDLSEELEDEPATGNS